MGRSWWIISLLWVVVIAAPGHRAHGTFVYTFDFPGNPGSGLAGVQSSTAPAYTTFGDWTRVNVTAGTGADVFDSTFWNNTSTFDPTQYESVTITADAGWHLNLQLLTFDETRSAGGPTKGRVVMFINGSTTPYATLNYNPSASFASETFNFTPTVDADNVTTVEYRFYGWNGGTPSASLLLDNAAITLDVVPEWDTALCGVFLAIVMGSSLVRAARRRRFARS